jgi:(S)-ureidoglycine aminohydrolase
MEISALTRSVVKRNHAVICPDGYVNSVVPGWTHCRVNVIISEQMGAGLGQTLITAEKDCILSGDTQTAQIFFYVISGQCTAKVDTQITSLSGGQFAYVPAGHPYRLEQFTEGTQIVTFHKVYEPLTGHDHPPVIFGDAANIAGPPFLGDPALRLQVLLPDNLSFDMAVNIFTYDAGGHLPFVETHIMEHGLLYLQGQGVYMLDHEWYPVKKGDAIWMAPYCQQWFTAMGKEPAVYIYYKNVNRFPTTL